MARRKITEPAGLDASELPELTPLQQEFVRLRLAGKNATDAYRAAYSTENMSRHALWVEASRLNSHPSVSLWLSVARQAHLGTAVLTRDAHMQELESIREGCKATGNWGAALGAEVARGKVSGHQVERIMEIPADPLDTLKTIAEHQPELAAQLAAAHGIPWSSHQRATKH